MTRRAKPTDLVHVEIVRGVAGLAVYVNDYRVAGQKPWGGGEAVATFRSTRGDFAKALAASPTPTEETPPSE